MKGDHGEIGVNQTASAGFVQRCPRYISGSITKTKTKITLMGSNLNSLLTTPIRNDTPKTHFNAFQSPDSPGENEHFKMNAFHAAKILSSLQTLPNYRVKKNSEKDINGKCVQRCGSYSGAYPQRRNRA